MTETRTLLIFRLDDQRYALELDSVERVISAVAVTPLPQAPGIVLGIIDVAGRITPVFNLRRRFRLPERRMALADQLILARTRQRAVALLVDSTDGLLDRLPGDLTASAQIMAGLPHLQGVLRREDGLVLIQNLAQFLSLEEERTLHTALERSSPRSSPT